MAPRADLTDQMVDGWTVLQKAPAQNRVPFWACEHDACGTRADLPHVTLTKALAGKGTLPACTTCVPADERRNIDHGLHLACGAAHLIGTSCPTLNPSEPVYLSTDSQSPEAAPRRVMAGSDAQPDVFDWSAFTSRDAEDYQAPYTGHPLDVSPPPAPVDPEPATQRARAASGEVMTAEEFLAALEPEPAAQLADADTGALVIHGRVDRLEEPQDLLDVILRDLDQFDSALPEGVKPSSPGASNLGGCERKLGHRLAFGKPAMNDDELDRMLKAWVGRAVHKRLAGIFGSGDFLSDHWTSAPLINPIDLYWISRKMVVDFKVSGQSVCDKAARGKVDEKYQTQLDLYGLCMETEGCPVERVALLFIPRNGARLSESVWYSQPYNRDRALATLARRDRVEALVDFAAQNDIPAERVLATLSTTEDYCASCPALGAHCKGAETAWIPGGLPDSTWPAYDAAVKAAS